VTVLSLTLALMRPQFQTPVRLGRVGTLGITAGRRQVGESLAADAAPAGRGVGFEHSFGVLLELFEHLL
jgi:hypothetical protein